MSARVESAPVRGSFPVSIVIAIIAAIGIGAVGGTLVTKAVDDRSTAVGISLSEAQRLASMENSPLAARFSIAQPLSWDTQKLDAMAGRVLYLPVGVEAELATTAKPTSTRPGPTIEGWDAYKLKAMEGRVLAEQVRAEDPPVTPHLPKRPPNG